MLRVRHNVEKGEAMSNKSRGQRAETALRTILQDRGYLVIRSAASKVYDLVCVDEGGFVFFLEVKSVKNHCYRVSRTAMTRAQHAQMLADVRQYGSNDTLFAYVVRFPDGEYRFYGPEREIMPQHEGIALDEAFPPRITPNNPPIVPHGSITHPCPGCGSRDVKRDVVGWEDCNACGARFHISDDIPCGPENYDCFGGGTD